MKTHIPELPDECSIKGVLAELPVPPWQTLLVADKPNRNGMVFTKECLEKAMADFQVCVDKRVMFVHEPHRESRPNLTSVIGFVKRAEFDGERVNIQIKFVRDAYKLLSQAGAVFSYDVDASGRVGSGCVIEQATIDAVYAYPAPAPAYPPQAD